MNLLFSCNIKPLIASGQDKSQLRRFAFVPLCILFRLVLGSGSEAVVLGSCGVILTLRDLEMPTVEVQHFQYSSVFLYA